MSKFCCFLVEIYSCEGTETACRSARVILERGLKFIPVRGRKRVAVVKECLSAGVEIYPREGTETAWRQQQEQPMDLKFIPVRGRKHVEYTDIKTKVY